jgi:hypothetical protein
VNRNRIMIGLLAALVLMVGGLYATQYASACDTCPAHAKAKVENATNATATGAATEATVQTADAKATSGGACCAAGKTASAKMTGAEGSCAASADAKKASAGKSCSAEGMKMASSEHAACASKEAWTAEATLTKLSHCGIDINNCDVDVLAAKLAEKGCGSYTKEQWASMINSAKGLDAEKAEAVLASAKKEKVCAADACPMSQVAKEMASVDHETTKN